MRYNEVIGNTFSAREPGRSRSMSLASYKLPTLNAVCLFLYIFGCYTGISIYSGATLLLPSVISLIIIIPARLYLTRLITPELTIALIAIILIAIFHGTFIAIRGDSDNAAQTRAVANLFYSMGLGLAGLLVMQAMPKPSVKSVLMCFLLFLLIGSFLEINTGFKQFSDFFRAQVYPRAAYVADERDILFYGGIRPKVLSLEPSFVGIWYTAISCTWLGIPHGKIKKDIFVFSVGLIIMAYLLRSPTLMFCFPLGLLAVCLRKWGENRAGILRANILSVVVLVFVFFIPSLVRFAMAHSVGYFLGDSIFIRFVAPEAVTLSSWLHHPLLGVGLGQQGILFDETLPAFSERARFVGGYNDASSARSLITNSAYLHWIFLGPIFGSAMLFAYSKMVKSLTGAACFCAISCSVIVWFTIGGYVTVQNWSLAFGFIALASINRIERGRRRAAAVNKNFPIS